MSITYREVLNSRNFRDFKVIAGKDGIGKTVENIVALEETFKNIKPLKNGWLLDFNTEIITEEYIRLIFEKGYTALGIKSTNICGEVEKLCNQIDLLIVKVPEEISHINIANFIDSIFMDNRVKKMYDIVTEVETNDHNLKIIKALTSLSREIERDVNVYDVLHKKIYSGKGKIIDNVDLSEYENIWNPKIDFEKKSLSDKINMFSIVDNQIKEVNEKIILTIELEGETIAYLVVNSVKSSYSTISSIKFYFLIIMYEYKMIYNEISKENKARDKIIKDIVEGKLEIDDPDFVKEFGKHKMRPYTTIAFRQLKKDLNMFMRRDRLEKCIHRHLDKNDVFLGILDFNEMVLIIAEDRNNLGSYSLNNIVENVIKDLEDDMEGARFLAGIKGTYNGIEKLKDIYSKSLKCLDVGSIILKESRIYTYEDIGPFIFFNIDEIKKDRENIFNEYIKPLLNEDDGKELVLTLKAYLSCNLNISKTAQKMYLHNNTIRYRINKIEDLLLVSLKDYFGRLKLEIALMFFDILS